MTHRAKSISKLNIQYQTIQCFQITLVNYSFHNNYVALNLTSVQKKKNIISIVSTELFLFTVNSPHSFGDAMIHLPFTLYLLTCPLFIHVFFMKVAFMYIPQSYKVRRQYTSVHLAIAKCFTVMSEDSKVDIIPENNSQLGPSAPVTTLNNGIENSDVNMEYFASQKTANGDSVSVPSVTTQLLRMLEAAKARRLGNLHSTEESSPLSDRTVSQDPRTDRVS